MCTYKEWPSNAISGRCLEMIQMDLVRKMYVEVLVTETFQKHTWMERGQIYGNFLKIVHKSNNGRDLKGQVSLKPWKMGLYIDMGLKFEYA